MGLIRFFIFTVLLICGACSQESDPEIIYYTVNKTLVKQAEVETYEEWLSSGYHPEKVFEEWMDLDLDSQLVCNELEKLSDLDLSVFEDQIQNARYLPLIKNCQSLLKQRLKNFWISEQKSLPPVRNDFSFSTGVINLDPSHPHKIVSHFLKPKQVVLTFDDGPHNVYTELVLATLQKLNVKSMFFTIGKQAQKHPELVLKMADQGHIIGSHTHSHTCVGDSKRCTGMRGSRYSFNEGISDVWWGFEGLVMTLGWSYPFFRFPYGESSMKLQNSLYSKGFFDFYWSVDSEDWKKMKVKDYLESLSQKVKRQNGGVILMHDIQKKTVEVLPYFLKFLKSNDFEVVVFRAPVIKNVPIKNREGE